MNWRKYKKVGAYLLLAVFFILVTPRSWWHDCHEHAKVENHHTQLKQEHCQACDFYVGNASSLPFTFHYSFYFNSIKAGLFHPIYRDVVFCELVSLRGPPTSDKI